MRLYLIKRRSDCTFFVSVNGHWALHRGDIDGQCWSEKPQTFFKTPEGVAGNLRKLCSEPYWDKEPPPKVCPQVAANWRELAWHKFDDRKLKDFEVVTMDVDVLSMTATPATEFVQIDAIRSRPLSRRERRAA